MHGPLLKFLESGEGQQCCKGMQDEEGAHIWKLVIIGDL